MTGKSALVVEALNTQFLTQFPSESVEQMESMEPSTVGLILRNQPPHLIASILEHLTPDFAASTLEHLPNPVIRNLLTEANPNLVTSLLGQAEEDQRDQWLKLVDVSIRDDFATMMTHPYNSAGRLMDTRVSAFRETMLVRQCLKRLRVLKYKPSRNLFLVNGNNQLVSQIEMQDLALSEPDRLLSEFALPIKAVVGPTASQEEVVDKLEEYKLSNLPVVDHAGHLIGVVRYDGLYKAIEEEATLDIQTMFGASKDERVLSKPGFAITKRLPWLHINLLTAFLASGVVGLFEDTISKFTALAVLLPVVAGQSGNAGAQALAVTMRGLALNEISVRQWSKVVTKEMIVGLTNGAAIALTTSVGVYFWSHSLGIAAVIGVSMIISMVAAGLAGASVPIILTRIGQDPATASSIILTTVTDVIGFLSFLGIATLFSSLL